MVEEPSAGTEEEQPMREEELIPGTHHSMWNKGQHSLCACSLSHTATLISLSLCTSVFGSLPVLCWRTMLWVSASLLISSSEKVNQVCAWGDSSKTSVLHGIRMSTWIII